MSYHKPEQSNLITSYKDIEIRYDTFDDRWHFRLRRQLRSAATLKDAKKLIDEPPVRADNLFKRTPIYTQDFGWGHDGLVDAEATSVVPEYGTNYVWVVKGKHREKRRADYCYPATDGNKILADQVKELDRQLGALNRRRNKLISRMTTLDREIERLNQKSIATDTKLNVA